MTSLRLLSIFVLITLSFITASDAFQNRFKRNSLSNKRQDDCCSNDCCGPRADIIDCEGCDCSTCMRKRSVLERCCSFCEFRDVLCRDSCDTQC